MPNPNYERGRRLEYKIQADLRKRGYSTIRASGSHGAFDVVGVKHGRPVELIQAKVISRAGAANGMLEVFKRNPPVVPDRFYHQTLHIYCTETRETLTITV